MPHPVQTQRNRFLPALLSALLLATGSTCALAQASAPAAPPAPVPAAVGGPADITLASGETLRGTLVSDDGTTVVLNHPVLGQLNIPRSQVKVMLVTPVAPPPPPPPPPAPPAPKPDPTSFFEGWVGSAEVGINGATGNSENFGGRIGLTFKRETSATDTSVAFQYIYGTSDGDKNTDRGDLTLRNDWKFKDSRWRFFALGKVEYDQFQDWDWRLSFFAGPAYEFIKTDKTLLLGRLGVGFSKEFGGSDNRIKPELDVGLDFEHKLDDRQKIFASIDYYPSLLNFPKDYRVVGKAGYEVIVDPSTGLALKLGVEDRYQSIPGAGKKKNDLLYFAALVLNF